MFTRSTEYVAHLGIEQQFQGTIRDFNNYEKIFLVDPESKTKYGELCSG